MWIFMKPTVAAVAWDMLIDEWETWNPAQAFSSLSLLPLTILKQVALSDADPQAFQAHFGKIHSVSEVKEKSEQERYS